MFICLFQDAPGRCSNENKCLFKLIHMEKLILLLEYFAPISPTLRAHLKSIIKPVYFKKGEIILREGEIANFIYYIESGLVRSYYMLNGKEVSNWFMKEGDIFISVLSFFRQIPSMDTLVALEDCVCWGISHKELEETYKDYPEFDKHGRLISNEYYCRSELRHIERKRQKPEQKYEILMEKDPDLVARVNNDHMASFLDVGLRTYNGIRKAYAEKSRSKGNR